MKAYALAKSSLKPIILILAVLYVALAIAGGFLTFNPSPAADMWDGYVNFFRLLQENHPNLWWGQHNEHRIFLSRLFFWVDFNLFNGSFIFLIVLNYFLIAAIFFSFLAMIRHAFKQKETKDLAFIASIVVCIFSFSWIQHPNLIWPFQNQFFLAHLMPLLAFYFLYLSAEKTDSHWPFLIAIFFGIASIGTMANGILVLPFLAVLGIILRIKWQKIALLALLSCIILWIYFIDYISISSHGSLSNAVQDHPIQLIQFILTYIGLPFYFMAKKSIVAAQLAGAFLILSSLFFALATLRTPRQHAFSLMLLVFIAYIGATALGTAGGRSVFGVEFALSGRYTTPALMAWSSLLLISFSFFKDKLLSYGNKVYFIVLLPALLFPYQFRALHGDFLDSRFNSLVGVLALELEVHDSEMLTYLYPRPSMLISISQHAREQDWLVFNHSQIKDAAGMIGQVYETPSSEPCVGAIESTHMLADDPAYVRVSGWIYDPSASEVPHKVFIINKSDNKIVGYAITGDRRKDLRKTVDSKALYAGFRGYMLTSYKNKNVLLAGVEPECTLIGKP